MGQYSDKVYLGYTGACYKPSPEVLRAIFDSREKVNMYPHEGYEEIRKAIAEYSDVKYENVMVTNGCDEAIALSTYLFGKRVLIQAPTYSEFERIARGINAQIRIKPGSIRNRDSFITFSNDDLKWSSLTWICSPNNPTGATVERGLVSEIAEKTEGMVAVDEAYYEYSRSTMADIATKSDNLIVTRTFSKAFAIGGLRLGYIISNPETIEKLSSSTQEFNVNRIARDAGMAALNSIDYYKRKQAELHDIKKRFEDSCSSAGLEVVENNMPFTILAFDSKRAKSFYYYGLKRMGIFTLDNTYSEFTGFSDQCIRIAIGTEEQMEITARAITKLSKEVP